MGARKEIPALIAKSTAYMQKTARVSIAVLACAFMSIVVQLGHISAWGIF